VDVGIKLKGHDTDADAGYCIRIHVLDKRARRQVPRSQLIPARFEGLWTDVIQGEYVEHHSTTVIECRDRKRKLQALQPGISIGNAHGSAGTLGMLVRGVDADSATVYVLSADHVLADVANPAAGDPIIQPGREDGGAPSTQWRVSLGDRSFSTRLLLVTSTTARDLSPTGSHRRETSSRIPTSPSWAPFS